MQILQKGEYTGEIVLSKQIEGSTLSHTQYAQNKGNPDWHCHENLHICFVFQGGKSETKKAQQYTEKDGSIFFYHAEETHRWISPNAISKSANIEIAPAFLKTYQLSESGIKRALYNNINAKALILKMQQELLAGENEPQSYLLSLLLELLSSQKEERNNKPEWVPKLKDLLHDSWNEKLSLSEMARLLHLHPITISKNFRKYFHCTLGEYQRKLKINHSIPLIKNSEMSLTEIAMHCGFSDQSHFIRNFKHATGFLPRHFQKF
ncbi:MAG: AraC family transcriptional regulator [Bacteroidia bacterium]|nr:AraC family transcriptional regulator [Bacteroidia bacterium]